MRNLNKTWENCLAMWSWIAWHRARDQKLNVRNLKIQWLKRHGFKNIDENCFFCESTEFNCDTCPGVLIDKTFRCDNRAYHWYDKPIKFYRELKRLDAIRRNRLNKRRDAKC